MMVMSISGLSQSTDGWVNPSYPKIIDAAAIDTRALPSIRARIAPTPIALQGSLIYLEEIIFPALPARRARAAPGACPLQGNLHQSPDDNRGKIERGCSEAAGCEIIYARPRLVGSDSV